MSTAKHTQGPVNHVPRARDGHCNQIDKGTLEFDKPILLAGLVKYADWIIGVTMLAGWLVIVVVMVLS